MKIMKSREELQSFVRRAQAEGKSIGLVPTMGYLHEGHLSLMKKAREENDIVIVSDFVNPIQFGPNEDYESYPRDLERDVELAQSAGVDVVFAPTAEEMYPSHYATFVEVEGLTDHLCGAQRPGHFRGVCTVVMKLFHLSKATRAYFGKKDIQQLMILRRMAEDMNMDIELVGMPIVREDDGLAKSSRNKYLSEAQRKDALVLSRALKTAEEMIQGGEVRASKLYEEMKNIIESVPCTVDYIKIVDCETLKDTDSVEKPSVIALAVRFGTTRLIDNMTVGF
ncbi:MAG: pantoate--beta-alanine ligase [Bacillota bacterium]|nr:pantoate--beta-alanine ligase [Bacillota bacterium]